MSFRKQSLVAMCGLAVWCFPQLDRADACGTRTPPRALERSVLVRRRSLRQLEQKGLSVYNV
jgi:hypothetical protein